MERWRSRCRVTGTPALSRCSSKSGKRAWKAFCEKILALYARGMTTRDIQAQLQELSGVEVSPTFISNGTEEVMDEVRKSAEPPPGSALSHPVRGLDAASRYARTSE